MTYYVYCAQLEHETPGHRNEWFAFEDGHYVTTATFRRATSTVDPIEADRMLQCALDIGPATIVTVGLTIFPADVSEEVTKNLLRSARKKLSARELEVLQDDLIRSKDLTN